MSHLLRIRLSITHFLQYFILGSFIPLLILYVTQYLNFSGKQAGAILSTMAISSIMAPIIGAVIADRIISVERLFAIVHIIGSLIMFFLSRITTFPAFISVFFLYMLVVGPAVPMADTIVFHNITDRKRHFGSIRVWGSVGWVMVAWLFSYFWLRNGGAEYHPERLADALLLTSFVSLVLGLYAFTLPVSGVKQKVTKVAFPINSLKIILKPKVLILAIFGFFVYFTFSFFIYGGAVFLKQIGFSEDMVMPVLSIGQMSEVIALSVLGLLISRLGIKKVLLLGLGFNILRFLGFIMFQENIPIIIAIACHGPSFALFFPVAIIFMDSGATKINRAGAHQFFALISTGIGSLMGSNASGFFADIFSTGVNNEINFQFFWAIPAIISILLFLTLILFFNDRQAKEPNIL